MISDEKRAKLSEISAALLDEFTKEADTSTWPSNETKQGRGDRVWMKKNAIQTLVLIDQINRFVRANGSEVDPDAVPLDTVPNDDETAEEKIINAFEAKAARMMGRDEPQTPH